MRVVLGLVLACFFTVGIEAQSLTPVGGNHVVCYYTEWSSGRTPPYNFQPEDIDPYLCTHIIYAFANFGTDYDFDKYQGEFTKLQPRLMTLKTINKDLKIMLGTGGWREGSTGFANITANQQNRVKFAKNAVLFLREHNFDGMDLNWQHPTFREGGTPQDKERYVYLAQTLRDEFDTDAAESGSPRLLLAISITQSMKALPGYDIRSFNLYMDFISVLCYDYVFSYTTTVKHHAPLYTIPGSPEEDKTLNINYTLNYFLEQADPQKLVLGIPTYGRTKTLEDPQNTDIGADADGAGTKGPFTGENGFLAYFEICTKIKQDNWTVAWSRPYGYVGPHAYKGNQWVGYDDVEMVRIKSRYARERGLAGVVFWTIDYDDFIGNCDGRRFPLINAAKDELNSISRRPEETQMVFPDDEPPPRPPVRTPPTPPRPPPTPARFRTTSPITRTPIRTFRPTNPPVVYVPSPTPPPRETYVPNPIDQRGNDPQADLVGEIVQLIERAGGMKNFCKILREAKSTYKKSREQSYNMIDRDIDDSSLIVDMPNLKPLMLIITNSSISIQELNFFGRA